MGGALEGSLSSTPLAIDVSDGCGSVITCTGHGALPCGVGPVARRNERSLIMVSRL